MPTAESAPNAPRRRTGTPESGPFASRPADHANPSVLSARSPRRRPTRFGSATLVLTVSVLASVPWSCSRPLSRRVLDLSPFAQKGFRLAAHEGGFRLSLDGRDCLWFGAPDEDGLPPAETSISSVEGPDEPGSRPLRWRRVVVRRNLERSVTRDDLAVRFRWLFEPDFWWAPHLAPEPGYVIAQHVFRSPALIAQSGPLTVAVVPDLDLVGCDLAAPWFLDLDAPAAESRLGLARTEVAGHVLFRESPGLTLGPGAVEIAFYVTAYLDRGAVRNPWSKVGRFLWDRWGRPLLAAGEPVHAPLESYIRHTYDWAFGGWRDFVWQEFDLDGRHVGAPQFIVNVSQSPNSPGPWFQREFLSVWNQAWFSSLRSASGLYRFARRTRDAGLMAKAALTKELALGAPLEGGLFPSVIRTDNVEVAVPGAEGPGGPASAKIRRPRGWETAYWTNSNRCPDDYGVTPDWYHVLDMSWTALLMLRWHEELDPDPRLIDYARAYADRLLKLQDEDGFFPGWLDPRTGRPGPVMNRTPETSLSVTFLLNLARLTGNAGYRAAALKAMQAVVGEIVPDGRWEDFETYWSCNPWGSQTQLGRKVERNGMFKQCSFSMFWTAEALLAAHRATGERSYLEWGRRTLDELAMVQQVWQPPFIHVPALGGFGVMNADGEWNDSRETLFAELFLDYYRETGDPVLFERGTAALRSGFIMMYCPENPAVKAMWEKVYPWFGPEDFGFTMENYGHGGKTGAEGQGMGSFTIYDWGNGAAAEAANRILDHYGQVYVDRARGRAFGLDAVDVTPVRSGWEVRDRTGDGRTLRVVFDDGTATIVTAPAVIPGRPAR